MKIGAELFENRMWQPGLILGVVVSLLLAIYFGYEAWNNSRNDLENIQQVREFNTISDDAAYFSLKAVSGDSSAIDLLVSNLELMDQTIEQLFEADRYTQAQLATEYAKLNELWPYIEYNYPIISDSEYAIDLLNAVHERLVTASQKSESVSMAGVEALAATGTRASQAQFLALNNYTEALETLASELFSYTTTLNYDRDFIPVYKRAFDELDATYQALMFGNENSGLRALTSNSLRQKLSDVNDSLAGIRGAESYIERAIVQLLSARESQQRLIGNFEQISFALDEVAIGIGKFESQRFPRAIHAIIAAVIFGLFVVGFVLYQRYTSKREIELQQQEGQQKQSAILRLLDELVDLADGDLTVTATVSEDFTGAIADSINFTIDQLRQLVSGINNTAVKVSKAAQGTRQTALHLAEASEHQAQEIAGASAAINEMAVTIDQVSANASESALVAGKSVSIANNGAKLVQNTIHGMDTIREQIQDTSKRIKRLGESSQEIGDIVSLINDIADQTNILALNAAIQASMAGDAGRGFAVVADEVQRLAERSAAATKQIESIVKTIQTDTNEAVISMEQTTSEVVNGARLAQDAGVALEEIEGVSASLAELIQNISNAARQQASSAGHISNTMNVIQEITSQTSVGTSATAESIGDLANMASELRESVAGFTLPEEMLAGMEDNQSLKQDDASMGNLVVPPTLNDNVDKQLSQLEENYDESDLSSDFLELVGVDEADLAEDFDIDLSQLELPDEDHKSVG